jgi:predicted DNA-binding protein YlxM (UPF0122 family)
MDYYGNLLKFSSVNQMSQALGITQANLNQLTGEHHFTAKGFSFMLASELESQNKDGTTSLRKEKLQKMVDAFSKGKNVPIYRIDVYGKTKRYENSSEAKKELDLGRIYTRGARNSSSGNYFINANDIEIRDENGIYRNFIGDTIKKAEEAGLKYYNEIILVTMCGTLPLRAGKIFDISRKIGNTHQKALVFYKQKDDKSFKEFIKSFETNKQLEPIKKSVLVFLKGNSKLAKSDIENYLFDIFLSIRLFRMTVNNIPNQDIIVNCFFNIFLNLSCFFTKRIISSKFRRKQDNQCSDFCRFHRHISFCELPYPESPKR